MFNFLQSGRWQASAYCTLPHAPSDEDESVRDWWLVLGGLALVLSRCPAGAAERRFEAASEMYAQLERAMRFGSAISIVPDLISDASHEVAEFADRATRAALVRRMRAEQVRA